MFERNERLRELFRVEITKALREIKDPGLGGLLTITDLELADDRKNVTVFYSVLGTAKELQRTARALERCAPYIHHLLIKRLKLKLIPRIAFRFDDTPRRATQVDKLLGEIERERRP
ncbi:MAG: 30S ribosome-binding factor RbfA [Elusimicrobia bacterium]|nr:30S ribosome-binding factor RbfA [Elusimicrobiota bacterium]